VGAAQLIADNACANLFILGQAVEIAWRDLDLAAYPVFRCRGRQVEARRQGVQTFWATPASRWTWIVNELSSLRVPLHAGEVVTTGTCVTPIAVVSGDEG